MEDVISDDAMFSDKFPIEEVDDIVYEVDCALREITRVTVGGEYSSLYLYKETFNAVSRYWR